MQHQQVQYVHNAPFDSFLHEVLAMKALDATGASGVEPEDVAQTSSDNRIYNFNEAQIVRDGRTITVCFPDEDQPLEEKHE